MLSTMKMLCLRIILCASLIAAFYCFVRLGTEDSFLEFVAHFVALVGCLRSVWWANGRLSWYKVRRLKAQAGQLVDDPAETSILRQLLAALRAIFCRENAVTVLLRILQSMAGLVALYCFFAAGQAGDSLLMRGFYYLIMFIMIGIMLFMHTSIPGRSWRKARDRAEQAAGPAAEDEDEEESFLDEAVTQPAVQAPAQAGVQAQAQESRSLPETAADRTRS